jgi:hypothetical protein
MGQEPGAAATSGKRLQRIEHLPGGDDHMRAAGDSDLRRLDLGHHATARQLGAGIAGHGLDLRRDVAHFVEAARFR